MVLYPLYVYSAINHPVKVEYHANENPLKYSEQISKGYCIQ